MTLINIILSISARQSRLKHNASKLFLFQLGFATLHSARRAVGTAILVKWWWCKGLVGKSQAKERGEAALPPLEREIALVWKCLHALHCTNKKRSAKAEMVVVSVLGSYLLTPQVTQLPQHSGAPFPALTARSCKPNKPENASHSKTILKMHANLQALLLG